ncbi:MAG TPA: PEP-CTERM sorting domain-containing protein [Sedimentisphaerales bacterium]
MKTILKKIGLIAFMALLSWEGKSQGFLNLDFESANLTGYPQTSPVPAANAFPSWTVNAQYIIYDDISLSGESISIVGQAPPNSFPPIQGAYYALLVAGNNPVGATSISIGQSGTIPLGTESITFWGNIGGLQISFAGQSLAFSQTGSTANYNIYAADVSAFAGQAGQLLFSLPAYTSTARLDNIQFSSSPVPEPSEFALLALGVLLFGSRCCRKFRST